MSKKIIVDEEMVELLLHEVSNLNKSNMESDIDSINKKEIKELNKDLVENTLFFIEKEFGAMHRYRSLTIQHLYNLFLAEDGCKVKAFGQDFFCENATDFFTHHLVNYQEQILEGDSDEHVYAETLLISLTNGERLYSSMSFNQKKDYFEYIPNISFIQWEKYNSFTLIVQKKEMQELKKFIKLCKLNNLDDNFSSIQVLKMLENLNLKQSLDQDLSPNTKKQEKMKI